MIASEIRRLLQCVTCGKDPKTCKCTEVDEDQKGMCKKWEGGKLATYIEEAPTVDAVPVIRCKDCKHQVKERRTDKRLKDNGYMVCGCDVVGDACGYWALLGQDEDFCSMAERKEE